MKRGGWRRVCTVLLMASLMLYYIGAVDPISIAIGEDGKRIAPMESSENAGSGDGSTSPFSSATARIRIYDQSPEDAWATSKEKGLRLPGKQTLLNYGCHLYATAHAIEWLTGEKRDVDLLKELVRVSNSIGLRPDRVDSRNGAYVAHVSKKYKVEHEVYPSKEQIYAALDSGGAILTRVRNGDREYGHYMLAVEAVQADIDNNGAEETWIHIVDSSCGSTTRRIHYINGTSAYQFRTREKIEPHSNYTGGEYWITGKAFLNDRLFERVLAYTPTSETCAQAPV